jgi:endonuclease/exonuclease/phosphatase (EEP) superfamily protein YafD
LELVKEVTQDMKLKEVDQFPAGRRTGDVNSVFWNGLLGIDKDIPIDRVYIRGFAPTEARVLAYQSSDHSPILFRLAVNP